MWPFSAISGMAILAFGRGTAFRGGIDVGIAALLDGNEVYGPVLVRAYRLENEAAEYPRFVVGEELFNFLDDTVAKQEPKTKLGEVAIENALRCRGMIVQDTDGRKMIDFLGTVVKENLGTSEMCQFVRQGHDFVLGEYQRFQRIGNDKLASRYYRLLSYYLARMKIWDCEDC